VLLLAFFELKFIIRWFMVLQGWVGLGVMLVYLAVASLSKAQCTPQYNGNIAVIGVCEALVAVGLCFTVLGCLGGKSYAQRLQRQSQEMA